MESTLKLYPERECDYEIAFVDLGYFHLLKQCFLNISVFFAFAGIVVVVASQQ